MAADVDVDVVTADSKATAREIDVSLPKLCVVTCPFSQTRFLSQIHGHTK